MPLNRSPDKISRPFASSLSKLKAAGLRPTRQRLALARLLFEGGDRHVTAEQLHGEAMGRRISVSLATIYNTLNQFTRAGLMREVVVEAGKSYFDTNVVDHHHLLDVDTGELEDVPTDQLSIARLPAVPAGMRLDRIDVVLRVRRK
jgi:Fur family iron response transcriptional regulator